LVNVATDAGLWRRSALYPELYAPVSGDVYELVEAGTGYGVKVMDLVAVELAPGEERSVTLNLRGFERTPFSVRTLTEALNAQTYLRSELNAIEAARQAILGAPTGQAVGVVALAGDRAAFADTALRRGYVARGLVGAEEVGYYVAVNGGLRGGVTDEPVAPAELAAELAAGTECGALLPAGLPECRPDATPLTTALPACVSCVSDTVAVAYALPQAVEVPLVRGSCEGYGQTVLADTRVVLPCDPNLMTGPAGYGAQRWVGSGRSLVYRVDFENLAEVSQAPAQVVRVRVPIDAGLDPATFRLGNFGFGSHVITVPPNQATGYTVEPYFADLGLNVRVTAGIDVTQRAAVWTFTSLDPATNAQPLNPLLGFLPVNDPSGRGQGFANFTIQAPAGTANGTVVQAQAQITFNVNAPIATNVETNRVDSRPPVSYVLPLVEILDTTQVRVRWSGADGDSGAGLSAVALYSRSGPNQPFTLQAGNLTGDSLTLALEWGHGWEFYTRATDAAGNLEAGKGVAEAVVIFGTLGADTVQSAPLRFALYPSAPNPFRSETQLRFELAVATEVSLEVFDVMGRRVAVPLRPKWLMAGPHSLAFRPDRLESGIYFARLKAGSFERTVKIVLMR